MNIFLQGVIAGAAMFCLDFAYAEYTKAVGHRGALAASGWAAVLILLSGVVTTSYISNPWMLVPVCIGAAAGTYCSVARGRT